MAHLAPRSLEVIVLMLGMFLLLAEAFSKGSDKSWMAKLSIYVLSIVLAWTFFTSGNAGVNLETSFYTADTTALFFKRIALLTTIIVLVMAIEFRGVLARYIPQAAEGAGTGEFYALPIFTCAGLMFLASAIDFLLIFVS